MIVHVVRADGAPGRPTPESWSAPAFVSPRDGRIEIAPPTWQLELQDLEQLRELVRRHGRVVVHGHARDAQVLVLEV